MVVLGPRSCISNISSSFCPLKCLVKGSRDFCRCMKMTAYPCSRKYSVDAAPRLPALKLSTKRTVLCSKGTVVPPDWGERKGTKVKRVFEKLSVTTKILFFSFVIRFVLGNKIFKWIYRHKNDLVSIAVVPFTELLQQRAVVLKVGRREVDCEELLPGITRHLASWLRQLGVSLKNDS